MSDIQFAKGVYFTTKPPQAPAYVLGKISLKREEVIQWLMTLRTEWVNIDCLMSKAGKPYCKLNNYVSDKKKEVADSRQKVANTEIEYPDEDINPEDIPF